jgi:hypothetical protein
LKAKAPWTLHGAFAFIFDTSSFSGIVYTAARRVTGVVSGMNFAVMV